MGKKRLRRIAQLKRIIEIHADAAPELRRAEAPYFVKSARCAECGYLGEPYAFHLAAVIAEWMK